MSAADREVIVEDRHSGERRNMLMFASNNYLGLANHPHVLARVRKAINTYGCGIGGPPLLNGYTKLIEETEEKLAESKEQESVLIFSSGFMANQGLISTLAQPDVIIIYDELSHASFYDGMKLTKAKAIMFAHNEVQALERLLKRFSDIAGSVLVCVEGVYSKKQCL